MQIPPFSRRLSFARAELLKSKGTASRDEFLFEKIKLNQYFHTTVCTVFDILSKKAAIIKQTLHKQKPLIYVTCL
jgi:hypothetical protein